MTDPAAARRELLEEVLAQRHRAIAFLPINEEEPAGSSLAWQMGLSRWAFSTPIGSSHRRRMLEARRQRALECAAIAVAWIEALDAELEALRR
jgi:hypothetical protein